MTANVVTAGGRFPPAGSVQFWGGANPLGTVPVGNGSASLTTTVPPGAHFITAKYSGDGSYPPASANAELSVYLQPTSLTLTPSADPTGNGVTFLAGLTYSPHGGAPPAGEVQFFSGCLCGIFGAMLDKTLIGSASLTNGTATLTVSTLPAGAVQVVAYYSGDSSWAPAMSNAVKPR